MPVRVADRLLEDGRTDGRTPVQMSRGRGLGLVLQVTAEGGGHKRAEARQAR